MHGIELRDQERRTFRLSAPPPTDFSAHRINAFRHAALLPLSRDRVARDGLSLARNGCHLSATSIPGSKLHACHFAPFQIGFRTRSTFRLHYRAPVCPGHGRFNVSGPLHFHHPVRPAAPTASTPLRDCYLPRDQSVQRRLLPAGPPGESARSPFAPRCRSFLQCGFGSTFQVRYVSAGLLFLKPLGTSFTMLPLAVSVNRYLRVFAAFSSIFIALHFNHMQAFDSASRVDKTTHRNLVFAIL